MVLWWGCGGVKGIWDCEVGVVIGLIRGWWGYGCNMIIMHVSRHVTKGVVVL